MLTTLWLLFKLCDQKIFLMRMHFIPLYSKHLRQQTQLTVINIYVYLSSSCVFCILCFFKMHEYFLFKLMIKPWHILKNKSRVWDFLYILYTFKCSSHKHITLEIRIHVIQTFKQIQFVFKISTMCWNTTDSLVIIIWSMFRALYYKHEIFPPLSDKNHYYKFNSIHSLHTLHQNNTNK